MEEEAEDIKVGGGWNRGEGKAGSRVVAILAKDGKEGEAFVKLEEEKAKRVGVKVSTENHNFTPFLLSSSTSVLSILFSPILPFPIASTFADRLALRKSPYHRPRPQHQSTGNPSG